MTGTDAPIDWGRDSLTDFFDCARRNGYASFIKRRNLFKALLEVDAIFRAVNMNDHPLVYPALMLLKGHSAFLTATELALTTRASESYAICRSVLESALYAFFMRSNPALIKVWASRHESPEARAAVRKKFQWIDILKTFKSKNQQWGERIETLYDESIDWGAHPNERSVHGSLDVSEQEDAVNFNIVYLSANQELLSACTLHVVRVGVALLNVQKAVFPDRFTAELVQRADAIKLNLAELESRTVPL